MKILVNSESEKMNKVNEAPIFISRYTEKSHKMNMNINDISFSILLALCGPKIRDKKASVILPPSKPMIGNRFIVPNANDDIMNTSDLKVLFKHA